jgi:hypothetical protein
VKLQDFEIISSIELRSDNGIWDLHNCGNFDGVELLATENAAIMRWSTAYPWRGLENNFSGLELRFKDLEFLRVRPRDPDLPLSEDTCVSDIVRVDPILRTMIPIYATQETLISAMHFGWYLGSRAGEQSKLDVERSSLFP